MALGTQDEIEQQVAAVATAQSALMYATLRLRALKGEALMSSGDSWNSYELTQVMDKLASEFGSRNLRMI
jgi:hypothetical protein